MFWYLPRQCLLSIPCSVIRTVYLLPARRTCYLCVVFVSLIPNSVIDVDYAKADTRPDGGKVLLWLFLTWSQAKIMAYLLLCWSIDVFQLKELLFKHKFFGFVGLAASSRRFIVALASQARGRHLKRRSWQAQHLQNTHKCRRGRKHLQDTLLGLPLWSIWSRIVCEHMIVGKITLPEVE